MSRLSHARISDEDSAAERLAEADEATRAAMTAPLAGKFHYKKLVPPTLVGHERTKKLWSLFIKKHPQYSLPSEIVPGAKLPDHVPARERKSVGWAVSPARGCQHRDHQSRRVGIKYWQWLNELPVASGVLMVFLVPRGAKFDGARGGVGSGEERGTKFWLEGREVRELEKELSRGLARDVKDSTRFRRRHLRVFLEGRGLVGYAGVGVTLGLQTLLKILLDPFKPPVSLYPAVGEGTPAWENGIWWWLRIKKPSGKLEFLEKCPGISWRTTRESRRQLAEN
ncbi:hypothetical protein C8R44DRAFT_742810 [Mycena epipterygia]|nr:hypothetical protein C8R44DRAFT_742810 [Mycena epipterygia]